MKKVGFDCAVQQTLNGEFIKGPDGAFLRDVVGRFFPRAPRTYLFYEDLGDEMLAVVRRRHGPGVFSPRQFDPATDGPPAVG